MRTRTRSTSEVTRTAPAFEPPAAGVLLGLAVAFVLLAAHAWSYRFLTDDAFISFRYARNLSLGHGLVFNPGGDRVEGYTNFLWVLLLASANRLGLAPEVASQALSLAATAALAGLVVWASLRLRLAGEPAWLAVVALALLAATRSVAVWSTSGLETRGFEVLVLAGLLRLGLERERLAGTSEGTVFAPWLLGLGCLMRPEGQLFAAGGVLALVVWALPRRAFVAPRFVLAWLPCVALVLAHFVFRRLYYGDWLPNTYYAKVGGRLWWSEGGAYLVSFAIEYAAWLWVPLAALGALAFARAGGGFGLWLLAATFVPYLLYVAAVGGDHFEYRPLDLVFPVAFLLAAEGLRSLARSGWPRVALLAVTAVMALGIWELPAQSRHQFPRAEVVGFPGLALGEREDAYTYLDPSRSPFYRWPPLRSLARLHRDLLRDLTSHFVGIRQEEHRVFALSAIADGQRVKALLENGALPRDVRLAMGAVGAIPYESDARTLDVLGLTDRHVAHGAFRSADTPRLMAHAKEASTDYLRESGVDLQAVDAHVTLPATSDVLLVAARDLMLGGDTTWAADVDGWYLIAALPNGIERARRRMPRLELHPMNEPEFVSRWLQRAVLTLADSVQRHPDDVPARRALAFRLLLQGELERALAEYGRLAALEPASPSMWLDRALAEQTAGDLAGAHASLVRAESLAVARADTLHERLARMKLVMLSGREDPGTR